MPDRHTRYELLERIGIGGMAEVFRARVIGAAGFAKIVAVKRILPDFSVDPDFVKRFVDEARLTACLQHPNICQVLDFGVMDDCYFIAMEYVDGSDLSKALRTLERDGEFLSAELCLTVMSGVLRGLSHAHQASDTEGRRLGIVHRDVSPHNVLLSINGDIKLSDFGAATANEEIRAAHTMDNMALGKLLYMAPEQRLGRRVDQRTDVFAAGVMLAELIQGPTSFRKNAHEYVMGQVPLQLPSTERFPAEVSHRIAGILERATAHDPAGRYADAASMFSDIEQCSLELGSTLAGDRVALLVRKLREKEQAWASKPHSPNGAPVAVQAKSVFFGTASEEAAAPRPTRNISTGSGMEEPNIHVGKGTQPLSADDLVPLSAKEEIKTQWLTDADIEPVSAKEEIKTQWLTDADIEGVEEEFSEELQTNILRGGATPYPAQIAAAPAHPIGPVGPNAQQPPTSVGPNGLAAQQAVGPVGPGAYQPVGPVGPGAQQPAGPVPGAQQAAVAPDAFGVGQPASPVEPADTDAQSAVSGGRPSAPAWRAVDASLPEWSAAHEQPEPMTMQYVPAGQGLDSPETDVDQASEIDHPMGLDSPGTEVDPPAKAVAMISTDITRNATAAPPWMAGKSTSDPDSFERTAQVRRSPPKKKPKSGKNPFLMIVLFGTLTVLVVFAAWYVLNRATSDSGITGAGIITTSLLPDGSTSSVPGTPEHQAQSPDTGAGADQEPPVLRKSPPEKAPEKASTPPVRVKTEPAERPTQPDQAHPKKTKTPEKQPRPPVNKNAPTTVTIVADPQGRAYVDGKLVSPRTPARVKVSAGSHSVMVVFGGGGGSAKRRVQVREGENLVVRLRPNR